jgi:hypothetical protein
MLLAITICITRWAGKIYETAPSALMQSDDSVDAREAAAGYGIEPGGVESFV